jgi:RNA polymerase sigma factor (sigma-70 family)
VLTSSPAAPFGEILTSAQQYRRDIASYAWQDQATIDSYVASARQGDSQAQHDLVLSVLHYVEYRAGHFFKWYSSFFSRLEYLDLVGVGNVEVMERLDEALTKDNPWSYLAGYAKQAMWHYCTRYASLILTPSHASVKPVESLDEALYDNESDGETLANHVPVPEPAIWHSSLPINEKRLYQALAYLTPKQRTLLQRLFGLQEHAPESIKEVSQEYQCRQTVEMLRLNALQALQRLLESSHDDLYTYRQACEVLEVNGQQLAALIRKHHLTRVARGYYPKAEIDALAAREQAEQKQAVYTLAEVCSLLGIAKQTFSRWQKKYAIPVVRRGYYPKQAIDSLLAQVS